MLNYRSVQLACAFAVLCLAMTTAYAGSNKMAAKVTCEPLIVSTTTSVPTDAVRTPIVPERISATAAEPAGKAGTNRKTGKATVEPVVVAPQDFEIEDDGYGYGGSCARAYCSCTSTNHGNPRCYANRGDCPNHEGLLCIW